MTKNRQTFSITQTAEILVPDKLGRSSYLVALLIFLLMILIITLLLAKLPPNIPLYFTLPWGEARLAPRVVIYALPLLTLLFAAINLGLGRLSNKLSPLLPRVLAVSSMVLSGMFLIALIGILQSLII